MATHLRQKGEQFRVEIPRDSESILEKNTDFYFCGSCKS